jgi:hypothetical protein
MGIRAEIAQPMACAAHNSYLLYAFSLEQVAAVTFDVTFRSALPSSGSLMAKMANAPGSGTDPLKSRHRKSWQEHRRDFISRKIQNAWNRESRSTGGRVETISLVPAGTAEPVIEATNPCTLASGTCTVNFYRLLGRLSENAASFGSVGLCLLAKAESMAMQDKRLLITLSRRCTFLVIAPRLHLVHCGGRRQAKALFPMRIKTPYVCSAILVSTLALTSSGQSAAASAAMVRNLPGPQLSGLVAASAPLTAPVASAESNAVEQLLSFKEADVKFELRDLMKVLRDGRHEGWVLTAYPDPKTAQALIGAGVSLDLPAREHPQSDLLNPHPFIEPSSAEIWKAAGLAPDRLQAILGQFNIRLAKWTKKGFRRKLKTLPPDITGEDAEQLLRVSVIQAIYNAKGYCRQFDHLTSSQQMALSQLVYQMGFNLQEFSQFLELINNRPARGAEVAGPGNNPGGVAGLSDAPPADAEFWRSVQQALTQSQWARVYRARAVTVIAMFDPQYVIGPRTAEQRVGELLRLARSHRPSARRVASRQLASFPGDSNRHRTTSARKRRLATQRKRGA